MEMHVNNNAHLADFISLNEAWILKYFTLEKSDKDLASNPFKVIENGGYIFSLTIDDNVAGVCALFNEGEGVYELARMAVSPKFQGKGLGNVLMKTSISKIQEVKAARLYLVSNTKLKPAINLYKKFNFVAIQTGQPTGYRRANIVMELDGL